MGEARTGHSPVVEDILKIIWSAQERGEDGVAVNEVAARMGVVPSTASENVARLTEQGLIDHKPYRKAHLTAEGRRVAIGIVRRHRLLETYLHEALGFDWDEVHEEAEALEHAVSDRLLERLDRVLGHPSRDPHGDPIPRPDGSVADEAGVLGALATTAALSGEGLAWNRTVRAYVRANGELVREGLDGVEGVGVTVPTGSYLAWLDFSGLDLPDGVDPARWFLDEAGVAMSAGRAFGAGFDAFCRLNLATGRGIEEQTVERLRGAIARARGRAG